MAPGFGSETIALRARVDNSIETCYYLACGGGNKVLHHLTKPQLKVSFREQARVLNSRGLLLHSFWTGGQVEEFHGLRFVYHTEASLSEAIGDGYEIVELARYAEMEEADSLYVVLRKRG
jgi:hypothetical protein